MNQNWNKTKNSHLLNQSNESKLSKQKFTFQSNNKKIKTRLNKIQTFQNNARNKK